MRTERVQRSWICLAFILQSLVWSWEYSGASTASPICEMRMCQCRSGLDGAELPCPRNTRPHVRLYTRIEKPVSLRNDIDVVQGDIQCVCCRGLHLNFPATVAVRPQSQIANSFQERKSFWIRNLVIDSPVRIFYGKEE
jgi:hypothetical protein